VTKQNRLFALVAAFGCLFSVLGRTDIFGRPHHPWIVWSGLVIGIVGSFLSMPKGTMRQPKSIAIFVATLLVVVVGFFIVLYWPG
jgi:hypothetical protein